MGRNRLIPSDHYGRCELFGTLRGDGSGHDENSLTAKEIQKKYASDNLKISTINQYAMVWHCSHENVLEYFKYGKLSYSKVRVLCKLDKNAQLDFLDIALNPMIKVAELTNKIKDSKYRQFSAANRYFDDGFKGVLSDDERRVESYLSEKLGVPLSFGRSRSNKLEWRIPYSGRDAAIELLDKFSLVDEYEDEDYIVEVVSRKFESVGQRTVQCGDIVVRFLHFSQFTNLLEKLSRKHGFY